MTKGFGLYVHWPFCQAKCPYCDFNSHVWAEVDQSRWKSAFLREITRIRDEFGHKTLNSIFFGGGTPSLMPPETVDAIISAARRAWSFANDIEITLEANPTSVEAGRFQGYASAGVNRVSVGVQALVDADLKTLGRLHSVAEARAAFDLAKRTFDRVSFDLIYARQNQSLAAWKTELNDALSMAADHLSLYQLSIEPGTAFGDRYAVGKLAGLPQEDLAADMYELTQDMTDAAGLLGYEISNHAAPGAESKHNLIYWRSHDWAGIGPGAHGRMTSDKGRLGTEAYAAPEKWLKAVEAMGSGEETRHVLTKSEAFEEAVLMGLRLAEGVALPENLSSKINGLIQDGLLEANGPKTRATPQGKLVLNAVIRELLT